MTFKSNSIKKATHSMADMKEGINNYTRTLHHMAREDWEIFMQHGSAALLLPGQVFPVMKKFSDSMGDVGILGMYNPSEGGQLRYIKTGKFYDVVKEKVHHRNVKESATDIGLHYWPALLTKGCDRKAFLVAERVLHFQTGEYWGEKKSDSSGETVMSHGGWDSKGDKGLSPWLVDKYWKLSGTKDCPKFRFLVKHHLVLEHRRIRKEHSISDVRRLFIAMQWMSSHSKMEGAIHEDNFSTKALICLGRLSPALRWAAIHALDMEGRIRVRHLNWAAVKQIQDKVVGRQAFIPARVKLRTTWWKQMKSFCGTKNPTEVWVTLGCPDLMSLKMAMGTFKSLMEAQLYEPQIYLNVAALVNDIVPAMTLARLFGKDIKSMWAYIRTFGDDGAEPITSLQVHDAGQCRLPEVYFSPSWGKMLLAKPTLVSKTRWFAAAETHLGHAPTSLEEAVAALDAVYTPTDNLLDGMSEHSQRVYRALIGREKSYEAVPAPGGVLGLTNSVYTLKQLEVGDLRAPMAGLLTDCCQHLEGAASECARASYTSPHSAIWAVFKGEDVVAQSWVWRSEDHTTLVLDSVEALRGHRDNKKIVSLFIKAAKQTVGRFGIGRVAVSTTSYGMTRAVVAAADAEYDMILPSMADKVSYSDATARLIILAEAATPYSDVTPVIVPEEDSVPYDAGFDVNSEPDYDTGVMCEHCEEDVHQAATICWNCGEDISEWVEDEAVVA